MDVESPPAHRGRDVGEDGLDHVSVVLDAELIGYGQEQGVGFSDRLISFQFLDQFAGFCRIGAAKNGAHIVDDADLIAAAVPAEVGAVAFVHEREYGSRNRHTRFSLVPSLGPRLPVGADLTGLLDVEGLA